MTKKTIQKPETKNQQNIYEFFVVLHAFKLTDTGKNENERKM